MVGWWCGVGVENVITMNALFRRIDGMEGGGGVMVWSGISYHHRTAFLVVPCFIAVTASMVLPWSMHLTSSTDE